MIENGKTQHLPRVTILKDDKELQYKKKTPIKRDQHPQTSGFLYNSNDFEFLFRI